MSLQDLGSLGEFVGAVAVVASLLYLALQMRQNTAALQVGSRQAIVESYRSFNRPFISDPTVGTLFVEKLTSYPELEPPDQMRFVSLLVDQMLHFQGALALHESGSLDDETFRAYRDFAAALLSTPGGAAFWSRGKKGYPSHMVASLDERIDQGNVLYLLSDQDFYPGSAV
jgi:hypothetical protein